MVLQQIAQYTREQFDRFIASMKYPPNKFQLAVLESIAFGSGNITVDAKAGSGKTSLLKMIASLLLDMGVDPSEVMFQAFNKSIEEELNAALPKGFTAKTSHSLGLAMCREYLAAKGIKLNGKFTDKKYEDIAKYIAERLHPGLDEEEKRFKAFTTVKKLIGFLMAENVDPHDISGIEETASHYGLDITPAMFTWMPYAIEQAIERFMKFGEMGFIDMIYMPVKLKMEPKYQYRFLLVDESQDLNQLQQEISGKLLHPEGRIVVVGDPNQAIYGFAAADAEAFQNLVKRFNTTVLELNICYRCPTSHIELAQSLVPAIEAAPNAIEGVIEYKHMDNITSMPLGSMVICRLNAPLVASYFEFIAAEKPAVIIGRDMGKGLLALLDKIAEMDGFRYYSIAHFIDRYFDTESAKLKTKSNAESKIAQLSDQISCLKVCADNFDCTDLDCFKAKLEALFVDFKDKNLDKSKVVMLCTVHRAKGLEADVIGLIYQRISQDGKYKNIMPLTWEKQRQWELDQEFNIMYVALTRAKQRLVILGGYKADETPDLTIGFERQARLELKDNFEDEDFELEGDKVYFGLDEGIGEDDEDFEDDEVSWAEFGKWVTDEEEEQEAFEWAEEDSEEYDMEDPEPMTAFALAEQSDNSHALLDSLDEAIEEATEAVVLVETEPLEPADPRLEKAHTLLKRTIRALRSALETTDAAYKKDYLWDAERYGKDFQVAQSQMNDLLFEERETLIGTENNRIFTWNNLRDRTYYLLGDDSNLGEVYTRAVKVLQAISKPSVDAGEELATSLPPRKPTVSELVHLNPDLPIDDGVFHRAVSIAQKLREAGLWDGETKIRFENAYDTHTAITGFQELPLTSLVLKHEDDEILVSLPENSSAGEKLAEAAPVVEDDTPPTEYADKTLWAKWILANKPRVVILDTETTDMQTNLGNFEMVQLGVINLDGEEILNRFIRPYVSRITEGAASVHGISHAVLNEKGATSLISQYQDVKAALQGKIIVAYNSAFDKAALENSLKLCGLEPIEILDWHCAMRMYTKHNPNKTDARGRKNTNWKLTEAVAQQGLAVDENAHDALADVRMTLALIQSMAADEPNRWKPVEAPKALPAPEVTYAVNDYVKVKASGVVMIVKRIMENGELNMVDAETEKHRYTMRPAMVEPTEKPKAEERPAIEQSPAASEAVAPIAAEPETIAPVEMAIVPTAELEAVVVKEEKTPKANVSPDAIARAEAVIRSLGNRQNFLAMMELFQSMGDEIFPEGEKV